MVSGLMSHCCWQKLIGYVLQDPSIKVFISKYFAIIHHYKLVHQAPLCGRRAMLLNEVSLIAKEMLCLFWTRGNTSLLESRLPHYCQVLTSFSIHLNGGEKNVLLSVLTWGK